MGVSWNDETFGYLVFIMFISITVHIININKMHQSFNISIIF